MSSTTQQRGSGGRAARLGAATLALVLAVPGAAHGQAAEGGSGPGLRWSGFATLGLTHHDNDTLGLINSFSQRKPAESGLSARLDSVAGLQLDLQMLPATTATAQAVARAGDNFRPALRMAYLRQQLGADAALRLGRIRSPLYLDSDVSEIGYAYLQVRAPLALYGTVANYVPHIDGADLQWRRNFGGAGVLVQAYGGRSTGDQRFYNTSPVDEARFELRGLRGIAASLGLAQVTLRASRTWIDQFTLRSPGIATLNAGLQQTAGALGAIARDPRLPAPVTAALSAQSQAVAAFANPFDARPVYTSLGFDANLGPWRLMGEQVRFTSSNALVGGYRGHQLTAGYAWQAFTPYVGVARNRRTGAALDTGALRATGVDPALDGAIVQLRAALDAAAAFADLSSSSSTVGLRWDVRDNMALKLQFDRMETPSPGTPGVFAVGRLPIEPRTHLFSATLSLVF